MIGHRIACLALLVAAPLAAQATQTLDGEWRIRVERDGRPVEPARPIVVPSAFETALGTDFDGVARYERTFEVPTDHRGAVGIRFAAVATHATVFVNGQQVGTHLGGWTPFTVDATAAVRPGTDNRLEVRVDEKVGHNTQGFLPIIQPHFGGIWQTVTLLLDRDGTLDRDRLELFGAADGTLTYRVPTLGKVRPTVELRVLDGERVLGGARERVEFDETFAGSLRLPEVRPWSPADPFLYVVRVRLLDGDTELDRAERKVGFRTLRADGRKVFWNDQPLQVRGVLHWGYSPPRLAPPEDPQHWRRQLTDFRSLGFNCIKCCLWVPPRGFYELCDELGMLVWQEYPTWHPQMDQAHKQELLTEYAEFFAHDRNHPSVAFRSITCETGHGADLDVVKALYDACKAAVPNTLVVDDSSWIGWQRITDFWDEHPYGNNSWFPGRLGEFLAHIREKGEKPLLLGECIAADTWLDLAAWERRHGVDQPWWQPICIPEQRAFESWLREQFGADTLAALLPASLEFGLRNRRFQIEQLRLRIPEAGYVVSVARDIPKCRMGLYDEQDRLKWSAADWSWHRDTMLCLDLDWNARNLTATNRRVPVRVSHFGAGPLDGTLRLWTDREPGRIVEQQLRLAPGTNSAAVVLEVAGTTTAPAPLTVHAELLGSHPARGRWRLWQLPDPQPQPIPNLEIADRLTPELLDQIEAGGRVLLLAGERKASPRTEYLWSLRGAPFAPAHPVHGSVPKALWLEQSSFDLETGRVMPWDGWLDQVDPILAFWETHDIPEVRRHLLAFDTRIGNGRLLVTSLRIGDGSPAGAAKDAIGQALLRHLADGPASQRALAGGTVAALRALLREKKLDLPVWRFRTDPDDRGRAASWADPKTAVDGAEWRDLRAGSHWENQADDLRHYTGVAWYRIDLDVPADWRDLDARAVFDGVDDSFELWLNGEPAGSFGDPVTKTTIWLERQVAELGRRLRPGERNTLVLRVVDHAGAGGLWKPAFLTTGPADARSKLLH